MKYIYIKNRSGRNLLINLYDNPRKLYKYYPLSKEYAVKLADDEKGTDILMFTPNLSREDASSI